MFLYVSHVSVCHHVSVCQLNFSFPGFNPDNKSDTTRPRVEEYCFCMLISSLVANLFVANLFLFLYISYFKNSFFS